MTRNKTTRGFVVNGFETAQLLDTYGFDLRTLFEELDARGYDLTTLRFSIRKKSSP